jgi:lipid-binding SYLF domain-containing protein
LVQKTFLAALAVASSISIASAADREIKTSDRLQASAETVTAMAQASDQGIPHELLDKARCVVIIPGMKKAGFILGAKYGRGFASCRRHGGGGWGSPAAVYMEGGSVGFQIGASETDVVLLVMNDEGMKHLSTDKFTLGGDATAAAGPVGRDLSAQTDAMMKAEILSYSRSRGLFAGISLEGASLRPDERTNQEIYSHDASNSQILKGDYQTPSGWGGLQKALNHISAK